MFGAVKTSSVVTITPFQTTKHILDAAALINLVTKQMEQKLVLIVSVYFELYDMSDRNHKKREKSQFVGAYWPYPECGL